MFELLTLGTLTGFLAGFFGIGGGMILVPLLIFCGYDMKEAIPISIMQMVFSSIFGTFLNSKKANTLLKDGLFIGIGGSIGGLFSGYIVDSLPSIALQYLLIVIVIFSILKTFTSQAEPLCEPKEHNKSTLLVIGFFIGIIAMSVGIGGSIMLTPILVGFMKYNLKTATSLGLFFVIFSSISGFISLSFHGHMLYYEGSIVGIASLIGVYFGIKIKTIIQAKSYKKYILSLYILVLVLMLSKTL